MKRFRTVALVFTVALATGGSLLAQVPPADNIPNWSVPTTWSPSARDGGIQTMTDVTSPRLFVGVAPCRIADTRTGQGFSGQAGPPIISSNTTRIFQISGSPGTLPAPPNGCAPGTIPSGPDVAVSFQFTVVSPTADGNLIAWPAFGVQPQASVLNWPAGTVALGNGTIVPLSAGGSLSVRLNMASGQSAHLVIDVNGYFSGALETPANSLVLRNDSSNPTASFTNFSTTCVGTCGLSQSVGSGNAISGVSVENNSDVNYGVIGQVQSTGTGSSGVFGLDTNASGRTYGVRGTTASIGNGAAGVFGVDGSGATAHNTEPSAGVRGESRDFNAVLGVTENGLGVGGLLVNPMVGGIVVAGILGFHTPANFGVYSIGPAKVTGDLTVLGNFSSANKFFVEPHPSDASKEIRYVSLEGPHAEVYFRGTTQISHGVSRIAIPQDFRFVADPGTYSTLVTPVGEMASVAVLSEGEEGVVVRASRNVKIHYVVYAERKAVKNTDPIAENIHFRPARDHDVFEYVPDSYRALLIQNGTLKPDGTVNMETARRLGWDTEWEERARPAPQPID